MMAKERSRFRGRVRAHGYGRKLGEQLFDVIEVRRLRLQQEPHLRVRARHLPDGVPEGALSVEYMGCLLTSVKSSLEELAVYLADCRAMGIRS
ncbi:MAG: hypothetical protein R2705_03935 [Ilumatobacteraceae bacterium]